MWKIIIPIALIGAAFGSGFYLGKGKREVQVVEREAKKEIQVVEKVVEKIKIVKPNGTVIEKEIFRDKNINTKKETSGYSQKVKSNESKYSFSSGLILTKSKPIEYYGGAGLRLIGPFWIETMVRSNLKELTVGLRMEL